MIRGYHLYPGVKAAGHFRDRDCYLTREKEYLAREFPPGNLDETDLASPLASVPPKEKETG